MVYTREQRRRRARAQQIANDRRLIQGGYKLPHRLLPKVERIARMWVQKMANDRELIASGYWDRKIAEKERAAKK